MEKQSRTEEEQPVPVRLTMLVLMARCVLRPAPLHRGTAEQRALPGSPSGSRWSTQPLSTPEEHRDLMQDGSSANTAGAPGCPVHTAVGQHISAPATLQLPEHSSPHKKLRTAPLSQTLAVRNLSRRSHPEAAFVFILNRKD